MPAWRISLSWPPWQPGLSQRSGPRSKRPDGKKPDTCRRTSPRTPRAGCGGYQSGATTAYTQPEPGKALPHAVRSATVKGGADDGRKDTFGYDKAGNTTTRDRGTRSQFRGSSK
ncbi:hypothetical protein [Streptomyces sp. SID11385]|uniref:hypothetical protein n=1 Tax=Streptomyces sp. SID11385 TaxID=2706031 RepID=UPI0013C9B44D|nr:hypothetical protein [Streptomyces sp. SID11385]NEA41927.1 hypothetical protein [Streptomyces sp. SID11385]